MLSVLTFWLFAQSVINVVPAMKSSLDISLETLTLAVSLSALFSGCFVVASGGLADKFGRMRMTTLGLGLSIVGSAMLVVAQGPGLFLAGRVLQGLSAASIMPATLALIKTWYEGRARQRAVSFWVIGSWGGSGLCSFVGGAIATGLGWRWIFVFSIAVALLALFLLRGTPESRSASASQHKLDVGGLLSLIAALVLVNLFISKGHGWGWSSPLSLTMLVGALAAGAVFIRNGMRKGEAALIDFALFRNRAYGAAVLSNFLLNGAIGTMMIASIWLQQGHHLTPLESGMMTLGYLVTVLAMIRVGEKLLQRYGARLPMMAGPVLTAIAIGLISCTFLDKGLYIGGGVRQQRAVWPRAGLLRHTLNGYGGGQRAGEQNRRRLGDLQDGQLAGRGDGYCRDGVTFRAVFCRWAWPMPPSMPCGLTPSYAWGAMAVSALLLPRASHS